MLVQPERALGPMVNEEQVRNAAQAIGDSDQLNDDPSRRNMSRTLSNSTAEIFFFIVSYIQTFGIVQEIFLCEQPWIILS